MKVAVLMGGRSGEREVSFSTGRGIAQALRTPGPRGDVARRRRRHACSSQGTRARARGRSPQVRALPRELMLEALQQTAVREADVVFNALHGTFGEDGTVQAALELMGKTYTGSGVLASALAMDKAMTKRVFEREALPTPHWMLLEAGVPGSALDTTLLGGYPLVVKPNAEGSTLGLSIVRHPSELEPAIHKAAEHDVQVLVEQYIEGRELTVAVIGETAYPVVEIEPKSGFYDYASKYTKGMTTYTCPAKLDKELSRHVRELAVEAAQVLGCRGVSRVDFRLTEDDEPSILEVNTLPGMTPTSLVPMAAAAKGTVVRPTRGAHPRPGAGRFESPQQPVPTSPEQPPGESMDRTLGFLKELVEANGAPGFEGDVATVMARHMKGVGTLSRDRLGSFICEKAGDPKGPRVMLAGHLDEVGFLVKSVTKEGFVKFLGLGGWWGHVVLGQRLLIQTRKGPLLGVVGCKPPHELREEDRKKVLELKDMYIDVGADERLGREEEARHPARRPDPSRCPPSR